MSNTINLLNNLKLSVLSTTINLLNNLKVRLHFYEITVKYVKEDARVGYLLSSLDKTHKHMKKIYNKFNPKQPEFGKIDSKQLCLGGNLLWPILSGKLTKGWKVIKCYTGTH